MQVKYLILAIFIQFIQLYVPIFFSVILKPQIFLASNKQDKDKMMQNNKNQTIQQIVALKNIQKNKNNAMLNEEDQFYVQPEQQQVRQIQQLQLPTTTYDKFFHSEENKNISLKFVQVPKEAQYQYKRFQFDKKQQSQHQEDDQSVNQQIQSQFSQFYSPQQFVYKKYHNESIAKFKNSYYFSGSFVHQNIFSSIQSFQSSNFCDIIKDFYQINTSTLPQQQISSEDLQFNSQFESGNLFAAFKISNSQYDLVMQMDKNSIGNTQWFFFSVQNMIMGKQYTFNVVNFTKNDSLFNYGMQPAVYSLIEGQRSKDPEKVWRRMGLQVSYKKGTLPRQNSRRFYYKLSFKMISKYSGDKLYISHSYPYSYTKLNDFIQQKQQLHKDIIEKFTIGKTLSKRPIECLKITNNLSKKKDTRKAIIVMARQHPGETQGSFVCEGFIEKLLSKSKESDFLRKNYIFYIIPMVNIDGVVYGHYRTNLSGKDLNRKWDSSQKQTVFPEVNSIKTFLTELSKQRQIRFILDLHGHSKKMNSFFYGNPCNQNPQVVRIFPFICSKISPAIQFYDCTFTAEQYKRKAARVYLSFLHKVLHVYTFEVSFYAYFKDGKKIEFTPKQFRDLGGCLVSGLGIQLEHQIKYQQSFDFNFVKNSTNKEFMNSPFVKFLSELRQNKSLMQVGCQFTSGSQSKPQDCQVNQNDIEQGKSVQKLSRPPSLIIQNQGKSTKISRKGQREVKEMVRPTRNMRFLQISKINSVLPDKYQLCLQPIKNQIKMNQTLKTSLSTIMKQNCECQTEKDREDAKYKQIKKFQIQSTINLSNSMKAEFLRPQNSNQKRYSSVIKTQNRNNIIFKIDFMTQQTKNQKISTTKKKKTINMKHAFSQTMISFNSQRQQEKQKLRDQLFKQQKTKNSQIFLPSVDLSEKDERKWTRNNSIKYDTVRIGNKRQAQIFLNGIVKKYLVQKQHPKQGPQPLSIFTKALQRPKSIRKKQVRK